MYRSAVATVFLSAAAVIAADVVLRMVRRRQAPEAVAPPAGAVRYLRVLINLAGFLCLAAVALTGFSVLFTEDSVMTGDRLIYHVTSAPAFALAGVAVVVFWSHRNRFVAADFGRMTQVGGWATP